MFSIPEFLKEIRHETNLSQDKFAEKLWVSSVLIAMIETRQREPSKQFITILANKLKISPFSIMPFLSSDDCDYEELSIIEKKIYDLWIKLQKDLIKNRSKYLTDEQPAIS